MPERGGLSARLRGRLGSGGKAFVPYVTAGLAGVDADLLRRIAAAGADAIEIGIPFSDPVMDGGVIQQASHRALVGGFRLRDAFSLASAAALEVPIVFMTYLNPVLNLGMREFLSAAAESGARGVIVPDLPVDEAGEWSALCEEKGVESVFLAAPGTPPGRLAAIAAASTGFVYCVSTYGVTGARDSLSSTARPLVDSLRSISDRLLLVGVGISSPEQAADACAFSDGVIVGSALVRPLLGGDREGCLELARSFREAVPRGRSEVPGEGLEPSRA